MTLTRAALATVVVLSFTGCSRPPRPVVRAPLAERVRRIREAFNRAECRAIHEDASVNFRLLQPLEGWLGDCVEMRADLGAWQILAAQHSWWDGSGGQVEGEGFFEKGERWVSMWWRKEDGRPRLVGLQVGGKHWGVPVPQLYPPLRLMDPPVRNVKRMDPA